MALLVRRRMLAAGLPDNRARQRQIALLSGIQNPVPGSASPGRAAFVKMEAGRSLKSRDKRTPVRSKRNAAQRYFERRFFCRKIMSHTRDTGEITAKQNPIKIKTSQKHSASCNDTIIPQQKLPERG
jgi:hypothetical protein